MGVVPATKSSCYFSINVPKAACSIFAAKSFSGLRREFQSRVADLGLEQSRQDRVNKFVGVIDRDEKSRASVGQSVTIHVGLRRYYGQSGDQSLRDESVVIHFFEHRIDPGVEVREF